MLHRNIHSVGSRAPRCHVAERRYAVLAGLQGLGSHFRYYLAGFLSIGLARHNSSMGSEISTAAQVTVANNRPLHSSTHAPTLPAPRTLATRSPPTRTHRPKSTSARHIIHENLHMFII